MSRRIQQIFRTFENGLFSSRSPLSPANTLLKMDNCVLDWNDIGAVRCINGFTDIGISSLPLDFERFRSLYWAEDKDAKQLITASIDVGGGFQESRIVKVTTAGVVSSLKTGLTKGATYASVVIRGEILFFNGTDTPFQITIGDGSVADIGSTRPDVSDESTISCALGGGGGDILGMIRVYLSKIIDADSETALSQVVMQSSGKEGIDCGSGDTIVITAAAGGLENSTEYQVYRTLQNGTQPFMVTDVSGRFTTAGDGSGTTTLDVGDELLSSILPYAHGDPPPAGITTAVVHFGRVWGLAGSDLYWSDLIDHESWWTEANGNKTPIFADDGDTGTALARTPNGILIWKEHHLYHASGNTPDRLQIQEITLADQVNRNVGTPSHKAVAAIPGGYCFYYNKGIYLYQDGSIRLISTAIQDDLRGYIANEHEVGVTIGYDPLKRWVVVSIPTGDSDVPTRTYIYDPVRGVWAGAMTAGFDAIAVVEDADGNEEFWGAGGGGDTRSNDIVHLWDGSDFNGIDIACDMEIPPLLGTNPSWEKVFQFVEPHFLTRASGAFNIKTIIDSITGSATTTSVSQAKSGRTRHKRTVNLGWRGRELSVHVTSAADQPRWIILGVNYGFHEEQGLSL